MTHELVGMLCRKRCGGAIRKHLLKTLADRANPDGSGIYASVMTLSRDAEISDRALQKHLRAFEKEGLLKCVGRRTCKNGYTSIYRLSLRALSALPDIKRPELDELLEECISDTGERGSPVNMSATPVNEVHLTGERRSPKPVLEPVVVVSGPAGARDPSWQKLWKGRLSEARDRAGDALNVAHADAHHFSALAPLCEPASGAPCDWDADVLPAIDKLAASFRSRRQQFHSWKLVRSHAIENRDQRLAGLPTPELPHEQQPPRASIAAPEIRRARISPGTASLLRKIAGGEADDLGRLDSVAIK